MRSSQEPYTLQGSPEFKIGGNAMLQHCPFANVMNKIFIVITVLF